MTRILGIDPGSASGAYAFISTNDPARVDDLPVVDNDLNPAELARLVRELSPHVAVVERVHAMPKQGVSSSFRFGRAYGTILGVLAGAEVPTVLVTPTTWKKHYGLRGADGEASRELAIRLYPSVRGLTRKKDHNRAEALLMAHWHLVTGAL